MFELLMFKKYVKTSILLHNIINNTLRNTSSDLPISEDHLGGENCCATEEKNLSAHIYLVDTHTKFYNITLLRMRRVLRQHRGTE